MGKEPGADTAGVPVELHEFYRRFQPFRRYDGEPVREFAPYQAAIWKDRLVDHRWRHYIRSPGVGLTGLLLLEVLNVILTSEQRTDALVVVADQFTAQKRRNELVRMLEGSDYSGCLVRPKDQTVDMRTQAMNRRFGVVVLPPRAPSDREACGITVESVIGFSASSTNMNHVLVLDAMESRFPEDRISWGLANAGITTMLTGGNVVMAMVPRYPHSNLLKRFPGINGMEPGALYEGDGSVVRRIPTSLAVDAGVMERRDDNIEETMLMGRAIRDAKYPEA